MIVLDISSTADAITHLKPLDAVNQALTESECSICLALLSVLRRHLEASIPQHQQDQQERKAA